MATLPLPLRVSDELIAEAIKAADHDEALAPLHTAAGIVHGDLAGVIFCNFADDCAFNEDCWAEANPFQKEAAIRYWLTMAFVFEDCPAENRPSAEALWKEAVHLFEAAAYEPAPDKAETLLLAGRAAHRALIAAIMDPEA